MMVLMMMMMSPALMLDRAKMLVLLLLWLPHCILPWHFLCCAHGKPHIKNETLLYVCV